MLRSLMAKLKAVKLLAPVAYTATVASAGVDTAGYGSLMMLVGSGAFAYDGTNKVSITVQHSDTDGSYVDVDAADLFEPESGAIAKILDATADGDAVHPIFYLGNKRWVRVNLVADGTVASVLSVEAVLGHPNAMPQN